MLYNKHVLQTVPYKESLLIKLTKIDKRLKNAQDAKVL